MWQRRSLIKGHYWFFFLSFDFSALCLSPNQGSYDFRNCPVREWPRHKITDPPLPDYTPLSKVATTCHTYRCISQTENEEPWITMSHYLPPDPNCGQRYGRVNCPKPYWQPESLSVWVSFPDPLSLRSLSLLWLYLWRRWYMPSSSRRYLDCSHQLVSSPIEDSVLFWSYNGNLAKIIPRTNEENFNDFTRHNKYNFSFNFSFVNIFVACSSFVGIVITIHRKKISLLLWYT